MKMNFIPKLKIIPLAAVVTLGLALSPSITMAAEKTHDGDHNRNHGDQKSQFSHDAGKAHVMQPRSEQHIAHGDDRRGHSPVIINHPTKPYIVRNKKVYYINDPYRHEHYGRGRTEYIVVDHDHGHYVDYDYVDFDDVRLQIGVHAGNFDIVFRD
jgi:hypothetical protein